MMKRKLEGECQEKQPLRPAKRQRQGGRTHLFDLSDELLLRSLSYLHIDSLITCERVCAKLRNLSTDNEIWREKYYNQFVRHRARRLPAVQTMSSEEQETSALHYSSKRARWLEHSHLLDARAETDWKHAFKVKHNWNRGRARKSEVQLESMPRPMALARTCRGILYTVDLTHGLRIWKKGGVLHSYPLTQRSAPSALAVDADGQSVRICIGLENGALCILHYGGNAIEFDTEFAQPGVLSIDSLAIAWPYILLLSASRSIILLERVFESNGPSVKCLASLRSEAALVPATLSVRKTNTTLVAGVCYAFNRFNAGWCLGLQEIRMDLQGTIKQNRVTSSISARMQESLHPPKATLITSRSTSTSPFSLHPQLMRAPNSLSYCGCYILAGLSDNTLMVYTITSTDDTLEIGVGRRLWGHTSAISAAEVTRTGKAVSISSVSDEMRYWELEEVLASSSLRKTSTPIKTATLDCLNDVISARGDGIGLALKNVKHEDQLFRRCVSFDDEQAIVVGECGERQIISCFNFA